MRPADLPTTWRSRADELEPYAPPVAQAFRRAAEELGEALREAADVELTLSEAARESGYSPRRIRELVAEGRLVNCGRKHAPRIRRADLPRKPRPNGDGGRYDVDADAASLLGKLR